MRDQGSPRRERIAPNLYRDRRSGRYLVGFTDPLTGRWRMKTLKAETRTDAKAERDGILTKVRAGEIASDTAVTVAQLASEWIESFRARVVAGERAPRTLERYQLNLNKHVLPYLGAKKTAAVRVEHVLALDDQLRVKKLSPWTRRGVQVVLSRLFAFGVRRNCCTRNPVRDLDVHERPSVERSEPRILLPGEIDRLLAAATETYRPTLAVLAYTGLRVSEALGLTWEDIDVGERVIRVRAQLERSGGGRPAARRKLKTPAANRVVPIPARLHELLERHKQERFKLGFAGDSDYVLGTATGAPIRYDNLRTRGLLAAVKKAGLDAEAKKPITLHGLRHGYGSMLIRAGDDVANVSRRLGHANPSITLSIYTHEINETRTLAETRERLDVLFG